MGVMGVLPAFDTCFKSAIQAFNPQAPESCRLSDKLDTASLSALLNVVQDPNVQSYLKTRLDGVIEVSVKEQNGQIKTNTGVISSNAFIGFVFLVIWSERKFQK